MADRSIKQILSLSPEDRKALYEAVGINKVVVDGNEFTDYGAFSFIWEKTFVKSPERSGDGTIGNLDSYATFLTPHLKIDFSMMSIDSYRTMMNLIYSKNEFLVTCYDVVNNTTTTNRMYFATEEMPKLWTIARALNGEQWTELLGVQDYTVELIGTNADPNTIKLNYYNGVQLTPVYSEDVYIGQTIALGSGVSSSDLERSGYVFEDAWTENADGTGTVYLNGVEYRIGATLIDPLTNTINLYARWTATSDHTMTFNYGLGQPAYDQNNIPITSIKFLTNETVGSAISRANLQYRDTDGTMKPLVDLPYSSAYPQVVVQETVDGVTKNIVYYPYSNVGWHWTNTYTPGQSGISTNSIITATQDITIYLIYNANSYSIHYESNGGTQYSDEYVKYGTALPSHTPYKQGYTFGGWYLDEELTKQAPSVMPPYDINLYAKWE